MKNVYESVRRGLKWNSTLFVLTYDEHGGFFDHVPPPQEVSPTIDVVARGGLHCVLTPTCVAVCVAAICGNNWRREGKLAAWGQFNEG